jgi:TonB family protein
MLSSLRNINFKAAAWTTAIHIMLFLIAFLFKYSLPVVNAAEELGIEVNLGSTETGIGSQQPENPEEPNVASTNPQVAAFDKEHLDGTSVQPESNEEVHASADRPESEPIATAPKPRATVAAPRPRYVLTKSASGGNKAERSSAGGAEGKTSGNTDQGALSGKAGASNYNVVSGTGGLTHTLAGRDISPRRFDAEFNQGGKVKIRVTVDASGKILKARVVSTTNADLNAIALQKINAARFSPSVDQTPEQTGDITIIFKPRS